MLTRFLETVDDRVAPTTVSRRTLTGLCHTLEDQVLAEDLDGTIIAGFQRARHWATERQRYEALTADPRRQAIVFTADDDGVRTTVEQVVVGAAHALAREWFVLALTGGFSAVVLGRALSGVHRTDQDDEQFLAIWSFDPTVVGDLLDVLVAACEDLDPAWTTRLDAVVRATPPRVPAPLMAQRFTNTVLERLEGDDHASGRARDEGHGPVVTSAAGPGEPSQRVALIVDDDPGIRGLEEALLRRAGWVVHAAADAQDARRLARAHAVDALLLDIHLAGGQRHDLVAELDRLRPGIAACTVIVCEDPSAVSPLDGRPVIGKPVVWAELRSALAGLMPDAETTVAEDAGT